MLVSLFQFKLPELLANKIKPLQTVLKISGVYLVLLHDKVTSKLLVCIYIGKKIVKT